jgi:hypothetical protein
MRRIPRRNSEPVVQVKCSEMLVVSSANYQRAAIGCWSLFRGIISKVGLGREWLRKSHLPLKIRLEQKVAAMRGLFKIGQGWL